MIYKRADSPYYWMTLRPLDSGRRIQRSTGILHDAGTPHARGLLKQQAADIFALAQSKLTLDVERPAAKPDRLVSEHLIWYRDHVSTLKASAATAHSYLTRFATEFAGVTLTNFTADHVIEWRARRALAGNKPATLNRAIKTLKVAIKSAVPTYLAASPLGTVSMLREASTRVEVLSREDEPRLLAALDADDRALALVAMDTLMRLGSLVKLQRRDIVRGVVTVVDPKAGTNYKVPLSARAQAAIAALPRREDGLVFRHAVGVVDYAQRVGKRFRAACRRAGIAYGRKARGGGVTFHCLRHTGATRMIQAGYDIRTVQAIGGWASLKQIVRYLHPCETVSRAAVEAIGATATLVTSDAKPRRERSTRRANAIPVTLLLRETRIQ